MGHMLEVLEDNKVQDLEDRNKVDLVDLNKEDLVFNKDQDLVDLNKVDLEQRPVLPPSDRQTMETMGKDYPRDT